MNFGGVRIQADLVRLKPDTTSDETWSGRRFAFVRAIPASRETALIVADAQAPNLKTLVTRQSPNRLIPQGVAWSPDGRAIAVPAFRGETSQMDVVVVDPATGTESVVGRHGWRDITHLAWLPDGKSLLVNAQHTSGETTSQIWLMSVPEGDVRRITNDLSEYRGLWAMPIDGIEQRRIGSAIVNSRPGLSSDGKWIYYTERGTNNFRIPIDGSEPVPVAVPAAAGASGRPLPERFHEPVPSPDEKMIAGHYMDEEQHGERIAIVPLDGGAPRLFPTVRVPVQWSADGKSLLYQVTRLGAANLWRQPVAGGAPEQVTQFSDQNIFNYAWSPGQSRWAIVRGNVTSDVVLISDRQ